LKFSKMLSNVVGTKTFFLAIFDFVISTLSKLIYFKTRNALHYTILRHKTYVTLMYLNKY
jgi:hypothetical protein